MGRRAGSWIAAAALLGACGPQSSSDATAEAAATAPQGVAGSTAAAGEAPQQALGVAPAPGAEKRAPEMADKFARRDPAVDGWSSEVWNDSTGARLKELGKLLAHPGKVELEALGALLASDFACADLRPEAKSVEGATRPVRVARNDDPSAERAHRGVEGAAEALSDLRALFGANDELTAQFKTITVDEREGGAATRSYVFIKSLDARPARQVHATWRCEWSGESPPKLRSIDVEAYEHCEAEAPLFEEATGAVFARSESFQRQLAPSLEHWAGRVERALGMTLIGHEGLALGDVDGDGLDDLYLCQPGGLPNRLFVRQGDGTLRDTSREAGVDFLDASRGALLCDLDDDGDQDLAVELDPWLVILENDGRGRFTERARAEVSSTTSISAADYDGDGDLDLYCCGYVVPDEAQVTPLPYHDANNGRPNTMLRNDSGADGWSFVDVTAQVGLDHNNRRFSFAASWEDYDDDGDLDLYVANDFGRNNLYRNEGGRFRDVAGEAGVEDMAAGMGVTWGDYDRDGRMDLYVSNMFSSAGERVTYQRRFLDGVGDSTLAGFRRHARGNSLFRNLGGGAFEDTSEQAGVTMGRWSWGSMFLDLDSDGWLDLVSPNGFVTGEDPEDL